MNGLVARLPPGHAVTVAIVLMAASASAQSTYSTVVGSVEDEQGGIIPGASITVVNEETGLTRTGVTGERGLYRAGNLPPGCYKVKVELEGFTTSTST